MFHGRNSSTAVPTKSGRPRANIRIRNNAARGGCDDAERSGDTEDGNAHGGGRRIAGRNGDLGGLLWNGVPDVADHIVDNAIDNAVDNRADIIDHPHVDAAAPHVGNTADNPLHDPPSVDDSDAVGNAECDDGDDR